VGQAKLAEAGGTPRGVRGRSDPATRDARSRPGLRAYT